MKYRIVWHEIAERVYETEAESFEEALQNLDEDWQSGKFCDSATLFNKYTCDATGETDIEFNGYW